MHPAFEKDDGWVYFFRSLRWKYIIVTFLYLLFLCASVFLLYYEHHNVISFELYFFESLVEKFLFLSNVVTVFGTIFVMLIAYLCWCVIYLKHIKKFRYMLIAGGLISVFDAGILCAYHGNNKELEKTAKDVLLQWIHDYHDRPKAKAIVDYLQTELECCGYESSYDWYYHANGIPPSCCIINFTSNEVCLEENTYSTGCSDRIAVLVELTQTKQMYIIFGISILMSAMLLTTATAQIRWSKGS